MAKSDLTVPVYSAKRGKLHKAKAYLHEHQITCRHSQPRKAEGILRVSPSAARQARMLLVKWLGADDGIISGEQAKCFLCPRCDLSLSLGATFCDECGEFVGDAHIHEIH